METYTAEENKKDDDITSVLIGASKPSQIPDSVKCIENTHFSKDELKAIDKIVAV